MTFVCSRSRCSRLLTRPMALEAVEEFLAPARENGELSLASARRLKLPDNALLHYMAAGESRSRIYRNEIYTSVRGSCAFHGAAISIGDRAKMRR